MFIEYTLYACMRICLCMPLYAHSRFECVSRFVASQLMPVLVRVNDADLSMETFTSQRSLPDTVVRQFAAASSLSTKVPRLRFSRLYATIHLPHPSPAATYRTVGAAANESFDEVGCLHHAQLGFSGSCSIFNRPSCGCLPVLCHCRPCFQHPRRTVGILVAIISGIRSNLVNSHTLKRSLQTGVSFHLHSIRVRGTALGCSHWWQGCLFLGPVSLSLCTTGFFWQPWFGSYCQQRRRAVQCYPSNASHPSVDAQSWAVWRRRTLFRIKDLS